MLNTVGLVVVGLVVILISDLIRRLIISKSAYNDIVLPPGSMGFPFIGETLSLMIPSYSLELHPFITKRIQRYGSIFRTSIAGRPVVVSADAELNNFLFQKEGKLVEMWYLDTFSKLFVMEGDTKITGVGVVHKYARGIFLNHFGVESLREKLLPQMEKMIIGALSSWSNQPSTEIKTAISGLVLEFSARQFISHDAEKTVPTLKECYANIVGGFMSFPINIPGTTFHKCLKGQKKVLNMLRDILKERRSKPERATEDMVDQIIKDMETEKFISEDFAVQLIFAGLFAVFDSVSTVLALAFKFLSDHPSIVEEMIAEHEAIIQNRKGLNSWLTWEEYKSMTFTLQVINETLRIANMLPGILRRATEDIPVKGFTIPKGWVIMLATSTLQLNPKTFNNPLEFNPKRWKELDSYFISKNFMPFGGGQRQCAGAEYSKLFMATFFHVLVTKNRWTKVKEAKIARFPMLGFPEGVHIKFSTK